MAELVLKRYATALFDLATEQNKMSQFEEEASMIYDVLSKEQDFMHILEHPQVAKEEKVTLIQNVFEGKVCDEFVGVLVLTVRKSRQNLILDILNYFIDMAKEARGVVKASVSSAVSLQEEQVAQIKANIEKNTGKEVELEVEVEPKLIGGMIIRVGDKVVDGSIAGKMQALKSQLHDLRLA